MCQRTLISAVFVGLLLPLNLAHAHNGRVGLAYPLEDITIDGDFSDWPDNLRRHLVSLAQYGDTPRGPRDSQASFRVAYSEKTGSLLVAVEVVDESMILDPDNNYWESQDGCEVYVDFGHGVSTSPVQYRMYGDHVSGGMGTLIRGDTTMEAAVQRGPGFHRYEWRIDVERLTREPITSGTSVGLDIAVLDRDEDGSFSWVSWGPWTEKVLSPNRVGDLLLLAEGTPPHMAMELASEAARKNAELSVQRARTDTGYQMFITGALLAFSMLHLLLFLFHPKARENLYYSGYTAVIALAIFIGFQAGMTLSGGEGLMTANPLQVFSRGSWIVAGVLMGASIVYKICHVKPPRYAPWFGGTLLFGWMSAGLWLVWDAGITRGIEPSVPPGFLLYSTRFHLAVVVIIVAEILRVTIRHRAEATWIVGIGFIGLAAVVARLLYLGQVDYSIFLGIGSLLISMSIFLASKVARTSVDLEAQLVQVRELSEKTLEQNRLIQEADRHKSDFLASMSHDLRTPMNAIIGYTRILLRRLRGSIDERQYQNLQNIDTSAHHLLNLINDILDLSKIEAGRVDIHPTEVDIKELIRKCLTSVSPLIKPDVLVQEHLDGVDTVRTDADRLQRILMNLLSNAVNFTERGSITVSLRSNDGWHDLAVADTGPGISPEDLPHIFDEFRQSSDHAPTTQEGTGLGLSIAMKSAELLGGSIAAESTLGQGTVFTLRFPDHGAAGVA